MLDFLQHEAGFRVLHALVREQHIQHKMRKRIHISKKRVQQIIRLARQRKTIQHLVPRMHRLFEILPRLCRLIRTHTDNDLQTQAQGHGRKQRGITPDNAHIL